MSANSGVLLFLSSFLQSGCHEEHVYRGESTARQEGAEQCACFQLGYSSQTKGSRRLHSTVDWLCALRPLFLFLSFFFFSFPRARQVAWLCILFSSCSVCVTSRLSCLLVDLHGSSSRRMLEHPALPVFPHSTFLFFSFVTFSKYNLGF